MSRNGSSIGTRIGGALAPYDRREAIVPCTPTKREATAITIDGADGRVVKVRRSLKEALAVDTKPEVADFVSTEGMINSATASNSDTSDFVCEGGDYIKIISVIGSLGSLVTSQQTVKLKRGNPPKEYTGTVTEARGRSSTGYSLKCEGGRPIPINHEDEIMVATSGNMAATPPTTAATVASIPVEDISLPAEVKKLAIGRFLIACHREGSKETGRIQANVATLSTVSYEDVESAITNLEQSNKETGDFLKEMLAFQRGERAREELSPVEEFARKKSLPIEHVLPYINSLLFRAGNENPVRLNKLPEKGDQPKKIHDLMFSSGRFLATEQVPPQLKKLHEKAVDFSGQDSLDSNSQLLLRAIAYQYYGVERADLEMLPFEGISLQQVIRATNKFLKGQRLVLNVEHDIVVLGELERPVTMVADKTDSLNYKDRFAGHLDCTDEEAQRAAEIKRDTAGQRDRRAEKAAALESIAAEKSQLTNYLERATVAHKDAANICDALIANVAQQEIADSTEQLAAANAILAQIRTLPHFAELALSRARETGIKAGQLAEGEIAAMSSISAKVNELCVESGSKYQEARAALKSRKLAKITHGQKIKKGIKASHRAGINAFLKATSSSNKKALAQIRESFIRATREEIIQTIGLLEVAQPQVAELIKNIWTLIKDQTVLAPPATEDVSSVQQSLLALLEQFAGQQTISPAEVIAHINQAIAACGTGIELSGDTSSVFKNTNITSSAEVSDDLMAVHEEAKTFTQSLKIIEHRDAYQNGRMLIAALIENYQGVSMEQLHLLPFKFIPNGDQSVEDVIAKTNTGLEKQGASFVIMARNDTITLQRKNEATATIVELTKVQHGKDHPLRQHYKTRFAA